MDTSSTIASGRANQAAPVGLFLGHPSRLFAPVVELTRVAAGLEVLQVKLNWRGRVRPARGLELLNEPVGEIERIDGRPGGVVERPGVVTRDGFGDRRRKAPK